MIPIPLPETSGVLVPERGGGSLAPVIPDRYSDHAAPDTERFFTMKFRDDGKNKWSKEIVFSLGKTGEMEAIIDRQPMGTYVTRQYAFIFSDPVITELISFDMELEILTND